MAGGLGLLLHAVVLGHVVLGLHCTAALVVRGMRHGVMLVRSLRKFLLLLSRCICCWCHIMVELLVWLLMLYHCSWLPHGLVLGGSVF
jgi:hypothetical protein